MTIIFLRFTKAPTPEDDIIFVTKALHQINPNLRETARTEDTITFTSPDHNVDLFGDLFRAWLNSANPVINTYRVLSD